MGTVPGARREAREAWRLVVAHHAGSLSAAVAKTRARNLAIGLGILALLGGSAAFLAVTGHRARALARQQMTFVAAVSHELRTPLAAIRSAGQNLADGVVSDPEQVRRYGVMVDREGERLTALVEQTLELSGMLARGRSVRLEEVDPAHLVGEVLSEVRPREPVEVDVPSGLGPVVADGVALRSALRNLVDNALKHGEGQSVAVHARMAGMAGGARELQLVVEDGGPGVPSGEAEHLFEPFYRGAAARAQGVPGSGLGLSLVRHVAESHGGRVSVGAGPGGRGVAFTLHLPLASLETRG
jgi:two-component system phosphate regulon sensor histidine kinase PhoR